MPTIVLEYQVPTKKSLANPKPRDVSGTASVSASPGRLYCATVGGRLRCFERVGVQNGNDLYREQKGA